MNCAVNDCKFYDEEIDDQFCRKKCVQLSDNIYDDDDWDCEDFEEARVCANCQHSRTTVYETGTIDDIEYRCPFLDNKLVYDDLSPCSRHFSDMPQCSTGKFEHR